MNKTDLANAIAAKSGLTKVDAKKAVEAGIEAVIEALKADDKVAIIGFGTLYTSQREAREGLNPRTKEKITIAAKKLIKFKPGAELEKAIQ